MTNLVSFENTFYEYFENEPNNHAWASCTIDGYPADENLPGAVVARVWITKHGDTIVRLLVKLLITIQLVLNNYNVTQDEINAEFNQKITRIKNCAQDNI